MSRERTRYLESLVGFGREYFVEVFSKCPFNVMEDNWF